jgi:hypothetical protein
MRGDVVVLFSQGRCSEQGRMRARELFFKKKNLFFHKDKSKEEMRGKKNQPGKPDSRKQDMTHFPYGAACAGSNASPLDQGTQALITCGDAVKCAQVHLQ